MTDVRLGSLEDLLAAWDTLPGGQRYSTDALERWLNGVVAPAVIRARDALLARHSDDLAVDQFAAAMKDKLAKKRAEGRGGWEDKAQCAQEVLSALLLDHVAKGDPIDVANLAMMLHQRGERIETSVDLTHSAGYAAGLRAAAAIAEQRIEDDPEYLTYAEDGADIAREIRELLKT